MSRQTDGDRNHTEPSRPITRRRLLATAGVGVAVGSTTLARPTDWNRTAADAPIHVRVYPGPIPLRVLARYGGVGVRSGWPPPYQAAFDAVERAIEQLRDAVEARTDSTDLEASVERGPPIEFPSRAQFLLESGVPTRQRVLDRFRDQLHDRGRIRGSTCHLLLWWGPYDGSLGYGGTRSPNGHVARAADEGAQTIVNVGATEFWDSRAVTRNLAIHEVFHTFLGPDVTEAVVGTRCDHNLGDVRREDENTVTVSPMATAYAGPARVGGETHWHGSGCYDHDRFFRHDGYGPDDRWVHVPDLSDGTLEAASTYVERYLVSKQEPADAIASADT